MRKIQVLYDYQPGQTYGAACPANSITVVDRHGAGAQTVASFVPSAGTDQVATWTGTKSLYDGMRFHYQHACTYRIPWLTPNPAGSMTIKKIVMFGVGSSPLGSNFPPTSTPTATMTPTETETCGVRNVCEPTPTSSPTPSPTPIPECIVTVGETNVIVRMGPNTSYTQIGLLYTGEQIKVSAQSSGWYQFFMNGVEHWIFGDLVTPVNTPACAGLPSTLSTPPNPQTTGLYCVNANMGADGAWGYCYDTVRALVGPVYEGFVDEIDREPTFSEIMAITVFLEFWNEDDGSQALIRAIGTEGVSRAHFEFCGSPSCSQLGLYWFLSGYQPWLLGANLEVAIDDLDFALDSVETDLADPDSDLSDAVELILSPSDSNWQVGAVSDQPWQWFNRDTSVDRPEPFGADPCDQVLLRINGTAVYLKCIHSLKLSTSMKRYVLKARGNRCSRVVDNSLSPSSFVLHS